MAGIGKITTSRLTEGTLIYVKRNGRKLERADHKQAFGVTIATVQGLVKSDNGNGRGGYTIHTDIGDIPFAAGMQAHFTATAHELTRQKNREAAVAEDEVNVLAGTRRLDEDEEVVTTSVDVLPKKTTPKTTTKLPFKEPYDHSRAKEDARNAASVNESTVPVRRRPLAGPPMPVGATAAKNYRDIARSSTTDAARAYWSSLAEMAEAAAD